MSSLKNDPRLAFNTRASNINPPRVPSRFPSSMPSSMPSRFPSSFPTSTSSRFPSRFSSVVSSSMSPSKLPSSYTSKLSTNIFKYSTLLITLNITGDLKTKMDFTSKMILPNEKVKRDGEIVYFSPIVKYTDELFKKSKIPEKPMTFMDQNVFRKLIEYGIKTQEIPNYQTNKSVEITNFNIKKIINMFFKEGGDIYIPYLVNKQYRKFKIRKFKLKTTFSKSERNKIKKDEVIPITVDIELIDSKRAKELKSNDYQRMDCKDKKKDLMKHLYGLMGKTYEYVDSAAKAVTKQVLFTPPTYSSANTYIANRNETIPKYDKSYSSLSSKYLNQSSFPSSFSQKSLSSSQMENLRLQHKMQMKRLGLPDNSRNIMLNDKENIAGNMMLNAYKKKINVRKDKEKAALRDLVKAREQGKVKFGGKKQKTRKREGKLYKKNTKRLLKKLYNNKTKTKRPRKTHRNR